MLIRKVKNQFSKKVKLLTVIAVLLTIVMAVASFSVFLGLSSRDMRLSCQIKELSKNFNIEGSMKELEEIAKYSRVEEIMAVDKQGKYLFTINGLAKFSDENAYVEYDNASGLLKYNSTNISFFERDEAFEALLNLDDSSDDDEDYWENTYFSESFMKENTYSTIVLSEKGTGHTILIICTNKFHPMMIAKTLFHVLWAGLAVFAVYIGILALKEQLKANSK